MRDDGMNDERLDALLRDAATSYRTPPEPPLDAMWERIEGAHFGPARGSATRTASARWLGRVRTVIGVAATLAIGIGIGRLTAVPGPLRLVASRDEPAPEVDLVALGRPAAQSDPYRVETTRYLGQTAALLIALPTEAKSGRVDSTFVSQAGDLLSTTRLLLDSPAARDPRLKSLLDDLELVLAQIARLKASRDPSELDLINGALEQRDVLPRLHTAVARIATTD